MANEAIKVEGTGYAHNMRRYTIANSPAVSKHSLVFLSGDNTASFSTTSSASGAIFLGITTHEKEAADGQLEITVDMGGVWDLVASGAINKGVKVVMAGGNQVGDSAWLFQSSGSLVAASGGIVVGTVMEGATDGERVRVDLGRK